MCRRVASRGRPELAVRRRKRRLARRRLADSRRRRGDAVDRCYRTRNGRYVDRPTPDGSLRVGAATDVIDKRTLVEYVVSGASTTVRFSDDR